MDSLRPRLDRKQRAERDALIAKEIFSLLRYDAVTGKLFWLPRPTDRFPSERDGKVWNSRFAGREAFPCADKDGYLRGKVLGVKFSAHRVAWLLQTGAWPADDIDHVNGVRSDNRWVNLRGIPHAENQKNRALSKNNTSGVNGVRWCAPRGQWEARIKTSGRLVMLGYFNTLEAAAAARAAANRKYGFSKRHGTSAPSSDTLES